MTARGRSPYHRDLDSIGELMQRIASLSCSLTLLCACNADGRADTGDDGVYTGITDGSSSSTDGSDDVDDDDNDDTVLLDMNPNEDEAEGTADDGNPDDCSQANWPDTDATLQGTVYAPNLELPISGALVYLTDEPIEVVPEGVYCANCVQLDCDVPFVLTEPDGSFSLPAVSGAGQQLVVQKGQFLRVIDFPVAPGTNAVPANQSNLPGVWNPANGMWIPRIGVYDADPDRVYNVLAKFGMGQVSAQGQLVAGTEQFTLIDSNDQGGALDDLAFINQFHILFLPCASTKYWVNAPNVPPARIDTLRAYVEAGGKLYATDHSNEYIEAPFPNYQEFHSPSMPDIQPAYEAIGIIQDPDLLAWLDALPPALQDIGGGNPTLAMLPGITTQLNYSGIDQVSDVIVQNDEGEDVNVGHHVWVEGPCFSCTSPNTPRPMAISGQYGCGRMMYSTFETSSVAHLGLNPQELVLLYMILEIGVCFNEPPPPPPPIG
jgi:hypothetical protein